jgi:hypothetical protein
MVKLARLALSHQEPALPADQVSSATAELFPRQNADALNDWFGKR